MKKHLKIILLTLSLIFLLAFVVFIINQIYQVHILASQLNPLFGTVVVWALSLLFFVLMLVPVVLYFRLPPPLHPPEEEEKLAAFQNQFQKRLARNKLIRNLSLDMREASDRQKALAILDEKADQVIRKYAKSIFLTTAISQNGKLDALTVLLSQTRMVWEVAHVYTQRPSLKDMINLYSNVGVSTFLATEIEDLDISRQIEPVIKSLFKGSAGQSIPLIGPAANVIMDSLLEGTTNAFLTLRVGVISKRYCSSQETFELKSVRKAAYAEASTMLGGLVLQTSAQVVNAILKATKKAGTDKLKSGWNAVGKAAENAKSGLDKLNPFKTKDST